MAADPGSTAAPAPAGDGVGEGSVSQPPHAHRIWVRVILVVATVLAIFAIFAIWANRQLLNPENWSKTSTSLLQKQTVRTALAGYLVNQLYANIDVPAQLRSGLPTQLEPLAGPLSGALHGVAEQAAERALENARVQALWQKANRAADQTLVTVVDGGGSRVQINGGTVSLNLRQVVADLATELGLPAGVAEKLPASVADLKIVTSSQLGLVRTGAKAPACARSRVDDSGVPPVRDRDRALPWIPASHAVVCGREPRLRRPAGAGRAQDRPGPGRVGDHV